MKRSLTIECLTNCLLKMFIANVTKYIFHLVVRLFVVFLRRDVEELSLTILTRELSFCALMFGVIQVRLKVFKACFTVSTARSVPLTKVFVRVFEMHQELEKIDQV